MKLKSVLIEILATLLKDMAVTILCTQRKQILYQLLLHQLSINPALIQNNNPTITIQISSTFQKLCREHVNLSIILGKLLMTDTRNLRHGALMSIECKATMACSIFYTTLQIIMDMYVT